MSLTLYKRAALRSLEEQQIEPRELVYKVNEGSLCPETFSKYIEMHLDAGTQEFLDEFCSEVEGCMITLFGNILRFYYSLTDSNAILNRGQMHVLSTAQLQKLLTTKNGSLLLPRPSTLLDIGAGDGNVTKKLKPFLSESNMDSNWKHRAVTTELSHYMVKRLQKQEFACAETTVITRENLVPYLRCESPSSDRPAFDIVSLLNVIDRCDRPLTLLQDIKKLLLPVEGSNNKETGIFILAIVFPWGPFVEDGNGQKVPEEVLPPRGNDVLWAIRMKEMEESECQKRYLTENENITRNTIPVYKSNTKLCACCSSFEDCVEWFIWNTLIPEGWEIVKWTRVPYISAGDMNCPYYSLDNAVFVLKPAL